MEIEPGTDVTKHGNKRDDILSVSVTTKRGISVSLSRINDLLEAAGSPIVVLVYDDKAEDPITDAFLGHRNGERVTMRVEDALRFLR